MNPRALPVLLLMSVVTAPLVAQTAVTPSAPAPSEQTPPPQSYGGVQSNVYTSATGAFRVKIPVLPELGGAISDTPNVVTFDDDFSTHISIGAFPLTRELKWEYEKRGTRDFLIYFFTTLVMPDFAARFRGASMEDNGIFLPKYQDGSMLIFTLLPGGSFFASRVTLYGSSNPTVAKRGNLCFVRNNHVFVVSTELAERVLERSTYKKSIEEETAILRQRLLGIVDRMEFIPVAQPPKP